ncbi:hypothetical protein HBI79_047970 [Parastagonospora nodorum]|nr:hypothetical protein HBI79_047970 [Parastagonospora nodorum]
MDDTPWLRDILRFALHATASTEEPWDVRTTAGGGKLVDPDDPGKDPRFRKMVEAILFSRRFLKTYNLVLLGILVVFTAWHWGERLVLHRRKRRSAMDNTRIGPEDTEAWSSSSSTIEGSITPPAPKKHDETSPLLPTKSQRKTMSWYGRPYYVLASMLQYQPRPIPIINKTLPTNATSLLVIAWLALTLFYNLYRMPLNFFYLFVFADRCGIIFIANLPLLYLLAAKNQPIKFLTGYSYESLNIFHRRVGEVMCLEAFLHFAGMFAVWYGLLRHLGFTLIKFIFNRVVLLGLGAFIAYEVIYFTSLGSFRKRWYEVFLGLHIVLQVAGLVFLWFHHYTSRPYVGISLAVFLIDRILYRMWLKSSTHPAILTVLEDDETLLLSANWEVDTSNKTALVAANMKNGWEPNQHIFISVPSLSRKQALQSHPFTIFSAAPTTTPESETHEGKKHAWFSLLIRAQGPSGFTHQLLQHARTNPTTRIRLDGPYGSLHALHILQSSSTAILIAGGSGIAVAYPLLYALLRPTDPESPSTLKVKLLWITHAPSHRLWVPEDKMNELEEWGLDLMITPPTEIAGRPDVGDALRGWVGEDEGSKGVVVSGPEGLVRDVRNICAGMVRVGRDVRVQVEKFGW